LVSSNVAWGGDGSVGFVHGYALLPAPPHECAQPFTAKRFGELSHNPFGGRMSRNAEPQDLPSAVP
jgi:hypothetical protein